MLVTGLVSIMLISGVFFQCTQDTDANINRTHHLAVTIKGDTDSRLSSFHQRVWTIKEKRRAINLTHKQQKNIIYGRTALGYFPPLSSSLSCRFMTQRRFEASVEETENLSFISRLIQNLNKTTAPFLFSPASGLKQLYTQTQTAEGAERTKRGSRLHQMPIFVAISVLSGYQMTEGEKAGRVNYRSR